jgi:hypothetical protein
MASKITAFKTHYTSTEEDEIIPETQYSSEEEEIIPETQFSTNNSPNEKQENNHQQHAKLMQALKDAIAETTRLNTKGGNVPTKVNILAFLQEAASIAQTLTPTTKPNTPNSRNADHRRNEQPQSNERFSSLENDMKEMKGNMSEMKELMLGFSKTYAQAVTTRRETTTGVASSTSTTTREKIDIQKEKERLERQQYEVMLSNHRVPEETKKDIASK